MLFKRCQIYTTSTSVIHAVALWHHRYCLHVVICEIHCFKLLFLHKCKVYLWTNYACILMRLNDVCRTVLVGYVYCTVDTAIFAALAVTMHLNGGNNPDNCPFPWEIRAPPNTLFPWLTWVFVLNWISIGSAVSPQLTRDSAYTLQWSETCPPKLPLPHLIHGSCGWPIDSTTQTAYRLVHPFLYGSRLCPIDRHTNTHRQTDHATSICARDGA